MSLFEYKLEALKQNFYNVLPQIREAVSAVMNAIVWKVVFSMKIIETEHAKIAVVESGELVITNGQSALDLAATIDYEFGTQRVIIPKSAICEDFFKLSTGVAGEVAQKFVNYGFYIAIVGDFSGYTSKPLRDYIYECNNGRHINFLATEKDAIERLGR
jgi:hypothetical protein